jgi:hypothetical protein
MRAKMPHLGSHIGNVEPIHQSEDASLEVELVGKRFGQFN